MLSDEHIALFLSTVFAYLSLSLFLFIYLFIYFEDFEVSFLRLMDKITNGTKIEINYSGKRVKV